jgi:hypoxanthine phosphoribosyltransferase
MIWEQYEVWATIEGTDELVDTTKSLKEARHLAKKAINEGATAATIYLETDDGDYKEVDRLESR